MSNVEHCGEALVSAERTRSRYLAEARRIEYEYLRAPIATLEARNAVDAAWMRYGQACAAAKEATWQLMIATRDEAGVIGDWQEARGRALEGWPK